MGHEDVLDGCIRSSTEFRRINNAKITAMRHRKWQKVRLQREQEEKMAAEEFLKRRKRERARLATYIYSSAQNVDKGLSQISQEHLNKNRTMWERKRNDGGCKQNNQAVQKNSTDKDIILDVCSLPTIFIKEEPCYKALQAYRVGDGPKRTEDTTDFLEVALQERLENEAATSRLIAEVTDMKSRLDDLFAKPSKGHFEGSKKDGFEHKKRTKNPCEPSGKEHDQSNDSQLRERRVADDIAKDSKLANKPKCCMHQDHEGVAKENQVANRSKCCLHNNYRDHALYSLKTDEVVLDPCIEASAASIACEQDGVVTGKLMGFKTQLRPESEGSRLQQQRNGEQEFFKEKVYSAKNSMSVTGVTQKIDCNKIGLSCHDEHKHCRILQSVSQGSCEMEADINILAPIDEDMHEKTTIETNTGCKFLKEHPIGIAKATLSSTKPKYPHSASKLSPIHKGSLVKQLSGAKESKDNASLCLKSRKECAKLLGFLDAENSLLASLERLDVKLAMASANISNSSRTSLVSAGHQSTKSAPCVIRRKPGSEAYSVNSTMFLSRPTTSQTGGVSLTSRRRQNVGLTNVPKERFSHFQTCNLQQMRRFEAASSRNQQEERKVSSGTIILHQNAEFLFS